MLFGKMIPILPDGGLSAKLAHAAVLNRERLEAALPAHRGGTEAMNPQANPGSKPDSQVDREPSCLP